MATRILDEPGASKHLRVCGVFGTEQTFTYADVRDDPHAVQLARKHLRRAKFVHVDEFRVEQRDGIYTVRWVTPSITAVPARRTAEPTVPPKAKRKATAAAGVR